MYKQGEIYFINLDPSKGNEKEKHDHSLYLVIINTIVSLIL